MRANIFRHMRIPKTPLAAALPLAACLALTSCDDNTIGAINSILEVIDYLLTDDTTLEVDGNGLGWLEKEENTENIEDDIQLNTDGDSDIGGRLPSSVDLTAHLPRVGDQGNFGTCVAWATAYNCRTWLNARANNLRTSQLNDGNTFSPADIFKAIPGKQKGSGCNGTYFEAAFDQMVSRGVATLSVSPYNYNSTYESCECAVSQAEATDAARYKIKSYREITNRSVESFKRYLYEGNPIVFGAKLGDNFMSHSGSSVLRSNGTFNNTGIHAYHAMVCVGYDDRRGAFRVVNSWGTKWGDNGFIWIAYDFFCSRDFTYCAFIVNPEGATTAFGNESSAVDLQPSKATDTDLADGEHGDDPTWRTLTYDIQNAGAGTVGASAQWGNCYLLYDAYNANNYTIVLIDLYSDAYGLEKNTMNGNWDAAEARRELGLTAQGYSLSNFDIPGHSSVASTISGQDAYFEWSYKMPDVSGKYYLVLMADAFSSVDESDESNNYYFLTAADGGPLTVSNGVITSPIGNNKSLAMPRRAQNAHFREQTAVCDAAPNTYSPEEISLLLDNARRNGELRNKAIEWTRSSAASLATPRRVVKTNKGDK